MLRQASIHCFMSIEIGRRDVLSRYARLRTRYTYYIYMIRLCDYYRNVDARPEPCPVD